MDLEATSRVCPRCRRHERIAPDTVGHRCADDGAFLVHPAALRDAGRDAFMGEYIAGRYGIVRRLGVGGMGAVYEAIDTEKYTRVALKFLRAQYASHPAIRQRFVREAEAGAAVDSPYVVRLIDFGIEPDRTLWLAMEYVEGWTLRDEVNHNGAFGVVDIVTVARHVLLGLIAAHDVGLIHRDLKHDNIMFCGTRAEFMARVLDFGVVKSQVADEESEALSGPLTAAGVLVGSPSYMSPEQIRGLTVGPPADLYALGVVMYEAMTARRLFSVNNYEGLLRKGAKRDVPPLLMTGGGELVPEVLRRIIDRSLANDPNERFPDARTMLFALEQMDLSVRSTPADLFADAPSAPVLLEAEREPGLLAEEPPVLVGPTDLTLAEMSLSGTGERGGAAPSEASEGPVSAEVDAGPDPAPDPVAAPDRGNGDMPSLVIETGAVASGAVASGAVATDAGESSIPEDSAALAEPLEDTLMAAGLAAPAWQRWGSFAISGAASYLVVANLL